MHSPTIRLSWTRGIFIIQFLKSQAKPPPNPQMTVTAGGSARQHNTHPITVQRLWKRRVVRKDPFLAVSKVRLDRTGSNLT